MPRTAVCTSYAWRTAFYTQNCPRSLGSCSPPAKAFRSAPHFRKINAHLLTLTTHTHTRTRTHTHTHARKHTHTTHSHAHTHTSTPNTAAIFTQSTNKSLYFVPCLLATCRSDLGAALARLFYRSVSRKRRSLGGPGRYFGTFFSVILVNNSPYTVQYILLA